MGNKQKQEINTPNNLSNQELEKEKAKIYKGSYDDRYKVENKNPLDFYDNIIDIDSFSKKPEIIWKILTKQKLEYNQLNEINQAIKENEENNLQINEEPKKIETQKKNKNNKERSIVVGMIGLGNVGKSYLLSLFTGEDLPTGESIHTKGISTKKVYIRGKSPIIILDSEGAESPLIESNISKDLFPEDGMLQKKVNDSDELIQTIAKDKKTVELFIQDFILEKSSILIIVVGQLTLTEQKLINRVLAVTNKDLIFVIHNLKNFYTKEQINNYIENTLKKNIFVDIDNFIEQKYKEENSNENRDVFNRYFLELYKAEGNSSKKVIHLIMGSNLKDSEAYYYNKTVVDYVRGEISSYNKRKEFDIIEELKDFVCKKGEIYVESEEGNKSSFNSDDIKIENDGDKKLIKITNKTKLKRCLINQLGFSSFFGSLYSPNYICYTEVNDEKKEKKFVVEINLCGKKGEYYKIENPKRDEITEDGHKIILSFTGIKILKEYKNIEIIENCSNLDSGCFRIDIPLNYEKYKFNDNVKIEKKTSHGIVKFTYHMVYEENNNEETKSLKVERRRGNEKGKKVEEKKINE